MGVQHLLPRHLSPVAAAVDLFDLHCRRRCYLVAQEQQAVCQEERAEVRVHLRCCAAAAAVDEPGRDLQPEPSYAMAQQGVRHHPLEAAAAVVALRSSPHALLVHPRRHCCCSVPYAPPPIADRLRSSAPHSSQP